MGDLAGKIEFKKVREGFLAAAGENWFWIGEISKPPDIGRGSEAYRFVPRPPPALAAGPSSNSRWRAEL